MVSFHRGRCYHKGLANSYRTGNPVARLGGSDAAPASLASEAERLGYFVAT